MHVENTNCMLTGNAADRRSLKRKMRPSTNTKRGNAA